MKKLYFMVLAVLTIFIVMSCGSAPAAEEPVAPPPQEPAPVVQEAPRTVEDVLRTYKNDLIMDGAKTYTVVSGDTLGDIAERFYGTENEIFFTVIMLASSDVVTSPDRIAPGMRLSVPDLNLNLNDARAKGRMKSFLNEIANVYAGTYPVETQKLRARAAQF
jgi:hypothetical protein